MSQLLVFDNSICVDAAVKRLDKTKDRTVLLFPLSAKPDKLNRIKNILTAKGIGFDVLETAFLLNESAKRVRQPYIDLIANLPTRIECNGHNLKEWFSIDGTLSMWWLSLVSEKNTLKSESFNRLAQFDAIVQVIKSEKVERIIFGCESNKLKNVLKQYSSDHSLRLDHVRTKSFLVWKKKLKNYQRLFFIMHNLSMLFFAICFFARTSLIKCRLGKFKRDLTKSIELLCITYYPLFDMKLGDKGIFKNKYYGSLQQSIEARGIKAGWVCMFVEKNMFSLKKSLNYAESFIKNGYLLVFLEEFNSIKIQMRALMDMLICGLKFLMIEKKVARATSLAEYNCYAIFKDEWYSSFSGAVGYFHLLCYYMWKNLLSRTSATQCLYYCEMQGWEKALVLAKQSLNKRLFLLAYQHSTVSPFLLNYFNSAEEFNSNGRYSVPQPDKVICNGDVPLSYMKNSGWPEEKLAIAEAIRYNHLTGCLNKSVKKKDIVLLVFSLNLEESSSLLDITYEALNDLKSPEVWIKSHPFLSIDKVLRFAGFARAALRFQIREEHIEDLLMQARIVIAGQSGVSFEALAFGCELITVDTPEQINMSPLRNAESKIIWHASSAEDLRKKVITILDSKHDDLAHKNFAKEILSSQFYLTNGDKQPDRFINMLQSC